MNISVKDLFYNKIKLPSNQEDTNIILQPGEIIIGKDYIKIGLQTDNEEDILNRNNIVNIPISQNIVEKKEYTYKQLQELKENNELIPGKRYILTDYYTQYYQPFGGINNVGEACSVLKVCEADYSEDLDFSQYYEKLSLVAISSNAFSPQGNSLDFPEDIIEYNFNDNTDEYGIFKPGIITRRIDTKKNIDLPYDWRKIKFARYKYDFTETNGSIYVVKKEGLLDSGEAINIKINKGDNIQKDNLYIYIDGDKKYFIYCINDSIFNGIDIDEISGLESTYENFVYFHDIYAFDCIQSPIYINENTRYCFNVEPTKYEFYTFEGEGEYHNIKMDPAENLPNNVFFINKNNELSNCYFGYNTENNTFINTYTTNITTKNNFKNNTCYNVINCSFENNCFNSILYDFENNFCSDKISYSILIGKDNQKYE